MRRRHVLSAGMALAAGLAFGASAQAQTITIGYQLVYNPWKVAIADDLFSAATGMDVEYRQFDSGAKVIAAMASGDLQVALAGSSPIAAGVSQGVDMELVWIVEDIASAEALVVRNGSGIVAPQDLKGKKLAVPFVSTTHFHALFALEQFGIDPNELEILNLQPPQIAAAWERGDIDAAFVWDPALGRIKQTGKVLITSGLLSSWGKATFDGLIANKSWASENPETMAQIIRVIADQDEAYRSDRRAWSADSEPVQKIVGLIGGKAEDVPGVLALYDFPTLDQQLSCAWLGCGADGGAARALKFTAEFLKSEKKIPVVPDDVAAFVNPSYAKAAAAM